MCARKLIGCTLVLGLLVLPGFVGCQPPADYSTTKANIDKLSENVKALSDEFHDAAKGWATQKALGEVRERVAAVEHAAYEHDVAVGLLEKKVNEELATIKADLGATKTRLAKAESSAALAADFDTRLDKVKKGVEANARGHRGTTGYHRTDRQEGQCGQLDTLDLGADKAKLAIGRFAQSGQRSDPAPAPTVGHGAD